LKRLLVIAFDGEVNPSTRLRILQYIPSLEEAGFHVTTRFVPYGGTAQSDELAAEVRAADLVFVQRVLDREVLRVLRRAGKPVVYDLDDGIHYIRQSQYKRLQQPDGLRDRLLPVYRLIFRGGKHYSSQRRPLAKMIELATSVIVGNEWLRGELALGSRVAVLPTAVWLKGVPIKRHEDHIPTTIGWIGVRSNLFHLEMIGDVLEELGRRYASAVELAVVSNERIDVPVIRTRFIPWSLETESDAVLGFDVGLMPLQDDPFSRAKCAFKAIFCMSRGVPVVASPVGANADLIRSGQNGYLASSADEWLRGLTSLVEETTLRRELGAAARSTIEHDFSAEKIAPRLERVLLNAVEGARRPKHQVVA
jgi:glycosyltransferase involved in cell wall biosynthesis